MKGVDVILKAVVLVCGEMVLTFPSVLFSIKNTLVGVKSTLADPNFLLVTIVIRLHNRTCRLSLVLTERLYHMHGTTLVLLLVVLGEVVQ